MCTINLTLEIPESKSIDIAALKQSIQAYVNILLSYPNILKNNNVMEDSYTEKMLDRFAGCWHGEESADMIMSQIRESRTVREPLSL